MHRRELLIAVPALLLTGCGRSTGNVGHWDMDPRLDRLARWAYACMLDVTGLPVGQLPVPPVLGVNGQWGNGYNGTFYPSTRRIKVNMERPYAHMVNIMLHEMGHDAGYRLDRNSEDFANWVNNQCLESVRPDFYPAPPIDWE